MNSRTRTTTLALGLALALGPPGVASANTTFCVKGPCGSVLQTHKTLAKAIDDAADSPGKDRIEIGHGSLTDVNVIVAKGNEVDIVGKGQPYTTVVGAADAGKPVIRLADPNSTVSRLMVKMGTGASGGGIALDAGAASTVEVVDSQGSPATTSGTGVTMSAGASLTDSRVVMAGSGLIAVWASGLAGKETTIEKTQVSGSTGLQATGTGTVRVRKLWAFASAIGVVSRMASGQLRLTNSFVEASRGKTPVALAAIGDAPNMKPGLVALGVTAVGGAPGSYGVLAQSETLGVDSSVQVRDSILDGFDKSAGRFAVKGEANIDVAYSDIDDTKLVGAGPGDITRTANLNVSPGFEDASTRDYALTAASPLIDQGSPDMFDFIDDGTGLDGWSRYVDGDGDGVKRVDMGAYEFQPSEPEPTIPQTGTPPQQIPSPAQQAAQQTNPPVQPPVDPIRGSDLVGPKLSAASLTKKKLRRGSRKPLAVRFGLSERARVEIRIERRTGRRWKQVGDANVQFPQAAGANTVTLTGKLRTNGLKPGSYRVTMFARDANANGSNSVLLPFRVLKRR